MYKIRGEVEPVSKDTEFWIEKAYDGGIRLVAKKGTDQQNILSINKDGRLELYRLFSDVGVKTEKDSSHFMQSIVGEIVLKTDNGY
jgi:hypothetical protein